MLRVYVVYFCMRVKYLNLTTYKHTHYNTRVNAISFVAINWKSI